MSVGFGLLKSVLAQGPDAFVSLSDNGITAEVLQGNESIVFSTIEQFYLNYGELPSFETIEVDSEVSVPWDNFPIEPLAYWISQVKEREMLLRAGTFITNAQNALGGRNLEQLRECIQQAYVQLEEGINDHSVKSIIEASNDAVDQHNQIQQNSTIPGIPFAFPYLNLISGGAWGGDLICYAGRPGTCKSYIILNEAMNAHIAGYKVLFVSMEMSILQCARRVLALRTFVNYTRLRLGRVSEFGMQRIAEDISSMSDQLPFQFLSGGVFGTVDRIYAQIKHYRPDIVYIDGAYLVRPTSKGGQRWEKALQVLEILKKVALTENIPVVITYQFNKAAPGTLEGIAMTDGVSQLSSVVISIEAEGNSEDSISRPIQYRTLKLLKGREGETGKIRVALDFDRMEFTQDTVISGMSDDFEYEDAEENIIDNVQPDNEPISFI